MRDAKIRAKSPKVTSCAESTLNDIANILSVPVEHFYSNDINLPIYTNEQGDSWFLAISSRNTPIIRHDFFLDGDKKSYDQTITDFIIQEQNTYQHNKLIKIFECLVISYLSNKEN